jgi:hypothetical protein
LNFALDNSNQELFINLIAISSFNSQLEKLKGNLPKNMMPKMIKWIKSDFLKPILWVKIDLTYK